MIWIFFYFVIFVFGLIVGSFLNCLIYRLESSQSFLKGRSFCPHCHHALSWQDLIPLFSFIFLKGQCRYCQKSISWQYPIVEIATAAIFLLIFNFEFFLPAEALAKAGIFNFLNLIYYWAIACFLIVIFVYDLKHYLIPDKIIYPAIAIALIFNFQLLISNQALIFGYLILSAVLAAGFFLLIVLISQGRWMGVADIKLAFLMGLVLGFPNILVALFLSFFTGALLGVGLIFLKRKTLKSEIPFGPFLVFGTFLALFWGDKLIDCYQSLFLL